MFNILSRQQNQLYIPIREKISYKLEKCLSIYIQMPISATRDTSRKTNKKQLVVTMQLESKRTNGTKNLKKLKLVGKHQLFII